MADPRKASGARFKGFRGGGEVPLSKRVQLQHDEDHLHHGAFVGKGAKLTATQIQAMLEKYPPVRPRG